MRKFLFFLIVLLLVTHAGDYRAWAESENRITAVYFYSPTCASCNIMTDFLKNFGKSHKNFSLKKYDISDLRNKSLLDKYCEAYKVTPEDEGVVPVIFIRDKYFSDEKAIRDNLNKEVNLTDGVKTLEINSFVESHERDVQRFEGFKATSVFFAGLINGINPCSMSMLLFFLSLLTVRKGRILKIGVSFIIGKFFAYMLIGTILFRFLSLFDFSLFDILIKILLAVVLLFLIIMSIQDYFAARAERYDRIFLQLPERLRGFNHRVIKKVSGFSNLKLLLSMSFFLGMLISLGEFLCTGQIYLATIITIFHTNSKLSIQALLYFIIYNSGMILPLLLLTWIVYKGKKVFLVSEGIRARLHIIKLINALILFVFGIIIFMFF